MEEINNKKLEQKIENVGFIEKPSFGCHSYTVEETNTMSFINAELMKKRIDGEKLELKNDSKTRYYLVENGIVFKCDTENYLLYQLNLKTMKWNLNQNLASLYFDTSLRFQELTNFKDYYEIDEELDLSSGRHLWYIQQWQKMKSMYETHKEQVNKTGICHTCYTHYM